MRIDIWLMFAVTVVAIACGPESTDPADVTTVPSQGRAAEAPGTAIAEASSISESTSVVEPAPIATPTPEPVPTPEPTPIVCETRPPVAELVNDRAVIDGRIGETVALAGGALFGVVDNPADYRCTQLFAGKDSLDYTSYNLVDLIQDRAVASFVPELPGNYRFGLVDESGSTGQPRREIEVLVKLEEEGRFAVRGIVLPDLFRDNGGPGFNINPEADKCRDEVIDHALSIAPRIGNNWIAFTPAHFLTQLSPTPVWGAQYSDLSLLDDEFYAALIDAAHARGLKVLQHEQDAPDFTISFDFEQWNVSRQTPEYWDAWFTEWQPWAVERAARAERFGVDMFSPYIWADDTFLLDIYPEYADRWREMIAAIREVYSGEIALAMQFFRPDLLTFVDDLDAVIVNFDGTAFPDQLENPLHPSVTGIAAVAEKAVGNVRKYLSGSGTPVYFQIASMSSDGQVGSEDLALRATFDVDYQEQVIYYEALFQIAASELWVEGVWVSTVNWFDQNARGEEFYYFDETLLGNPRSKPAEDVMALWFEGASR